MIDWIMVMG